MNIINEQTRAYAKIFSKILDLDVESILAYFIIVQFKNLTTGDILDKLKGQSQYFTKLSITQPANIKSTLIDKLKAKGLIYSQKINSKVVYNITNPDVIFDQIIVKLDSDRGELEKLKNFLSERWGYREDCVEEKEKFINLKGIDPILKDISQYKLTRMVVCDVDFTWLEERKWFINLYGSIIHKKKIKTPITIILCELNSEENENSTYLISYDPVLRKNYGIKMIDSNIYAYFWEKYKVEG